jgi:hypothetical protein
MVVIKGKEKKVNKPISGLKQMSKEARRKLKRPQDTQPIPTVCV